MGKVVREEMFRHFMKLKGWEGTDEPMKVSIFNAIVAYTK